MYTTEHRFVGGEGSLSDEKSVFSCVEGGRGVMEGAINVCSILFGYMLYVI